MRTHTGEMRYSCTKCNDKFRYHQSAKAHEKSCPGTKKSRNLPTSENPEGSSDEPDQNALKSKRSRTSLNSTAISEVKSELVTSDRASVTTTRLVTKNAANSAPSGGLNQENQSDSETVADRSDFKSVSKSRSGTKKLRNPETSENPQASSNQPDQNALKSKRSCTSLNSAAVSHVKSELVISNEGNINTARSETKIAADSAPSGGINEKSQSDSENVADRSECKLCPSKTPFNNLKILTGHVRSKHKLTLDEYREKVARNEKQEEYLAESSTFLAACKVCCTILVSKSGLHRHIDEKHGLSLDEYNML